MSTPEIDQSGLFNEIADGQEYPLNEKWYSHLLEQYKLYVEMADRISNRRATANSYFLSLNTAILAFVGLLSSQHAGEYLWLLALAGVTLSFLWQALVRSYSNLNTAKFLVIHRIEKRLPISPYDAEWEALGRGRNYRLYKPITHIERGVPYIFIMLHVIVFARSVSLPAWLLNRLGAQ